MLLDYFSAVLSGPWITGKLDTQWRLDGRTLYIQASSSRLDWLLNFLFFAVPVIPYKRMAKPYRTHLGFFAAYKANADIIQSLDFDIIVGYSRGAALALYVHEDRLFRTGITPETILFGCPAAVMTRDKTVLSRWDRVARYDCPHDVVPWVLRLVGYRHVGRRVKLGGKIKRPKDYDLLAWLSRHSPEEYRQRLADQKSNKTDFK